MLFDTGPAVFESEKERNLYYKVFAGYLFNEYISGVEERVSRFCAWINEAASRGKAAADTVISLNPATTHVSFDNHAYLFSGIDADRGEFADILIHDYSTRTVVTIEAKVHSDWSYSKDIRKNGERLKLIEAQMENVIFVPCLLVSENKWLECQRSQNHPQSNYGQFMQMDDNRFRVLLWEDLVKLIEAHAVQSFVKSVLSHPPKAAAYGFREGWFWR